MKKLVMAPTDLRRRFLQMIDRERRRALGGQRAEIVAKMNALTDGEIVDALYAASTAGVRIQLNVRGVCVLRPGIAGLSDNIEVVSIVDRFLEHSRIYYFFNGAAEDVFLASADWMTRNLDKRVELMFPVEDAEHKARILYALRAMFRDNVKARWLDANGDYARREPAPGDAAFRVQQHLQDETRRLAALAQDRAGITLKPEESGTRSATVLDRPLPRGRSTMTP
jgi:polyphosphate kinase